MVTVSDVPKLVQHVDGDGQRRRTSSEGSEPISNEDLLVVECDVLMPAALGHVLTERNAGDVRAKYVVEGS